MGGHERRPCVPEQYTNIILMFVKYFMFGRLIGFTLGCYVFREVRTNDRIAGIFGLMWLFALLLVCLPYAYGYAYGVAH